MINPDNVGETTPAKIRTYTNELKTNLIDEDIVAAKTIIQAESSFTTSTITSASVATNTAIANFDFNINPIKSIVVGGHIDIYVPAGFKVATVSAANCLLDPNPLGAYAAVSECKNVDNYIRITLNAGFPLNNVHGIRLLNVITTPNYAGLYMFDVTTYG